MSDLNGKPALNAALNSPQALTAALTSAPRFGATMAPGIPMGGGSYTLPPATASVLGGVKIGANIAVQPDGTISVATPGISGVGVQLLGANIGTQPTLNFSVVQPGMSFSAANDAANSRINLQFGADVVKVFGRTGLVVAASGDYTAAQVTNAVDKTATYPNPVWITSFDWNKLFNVPPFVSTFNSRAGAVIPATGDYTAAQVTNAVDSTQAYSNPAWITAIPWSILSGSPSSAQIAAIQTPWLQNIDGGNFTLGNVQQIGIGIALASVNAPLITRYSGSANPNAGIVLLDNSLASSSTSLSTNIGAYGTDYVNPSATTGMLWRIGCNSGSKDLQIANIRSTNITFWNGATRLTLGTSASFLASTLAVNSNAAPNAACHVIDAINSANGTVRLYAPVAAANDYCAVSFSNVQTASNITAAMKFRLIASGHMAFDFLAQSSGQTTIATLPSVMTLQGNGNVGIGTASPGSNLEVALSAAAGPVVSLRNNQGTSLNAVLQFTNSAGVENWSIIPDWNGNGGTELNICAASNSRRVTILQSGNVGIGTASPAALLNVKLGTNPDSTGQPVGTWASIIYNATNASGYNGLLVKNNWATSTSSVFQVGLDVVGGAFNSFLMVRGDGNVGIGTTAPTSKLHVAGLVVYASDSAAGTAGLTTGAFFVDSTGVVHAKQ